MKRQLFFAIFCILLGAGALLAQQAIYCSIVGNVTDQTGAVVPGASVTVTNVATGVAIEVKTDERGLHQVLNLNPGTYTVKVTGAGFKTFVRENVVLSGGLQVRVDATLEVGAVTESVTVTAAATQINTETATTTLPPITTYQTLTLPNHGMQGRPDPYNQLSIGYADINNAAFSIGGTMSVQHANVEDGMRTAMRGQESMSHPSSEAVEELVVTTVNYSARLFHPSATELVLKSGTNDWHGSLLYLHGNRALNARGYFSHVKTPYKLHQWGGSVGGPIRKNKTFLFFDYQGFLSPALWEYYSTIPSLKMKQGDLSDFLDPAYLTKIGRAAPIVITDPRTGQPFPNNVIPDSMISPVAKKFMAFWPAPNRDEGRGYMRNLYNAGDYEAKERHFDLRLDHYFTPTEHFYGRFMYKHQPQGVDQTSLPNFGGNWFILKNRTLTLHHTSTIRPNLINHVMVGMWQDRSPGGPGGPGIYTQPGSEFAYNKDLGISGIPEKQDFGAPWLSFSQTALTTPYSSVGFSTGLRRIWHVKNDLSWMRGRHNIQAGFEFRHDRQGVEGPGLDGYGSWCTFGCINFTGRWSGLDFADFLLGLPFSSSRQILPELDFKDRSEWGGYLQDDIKWSSQWSFSVGLRYDYFPVVRSEHDFASVFDPATRQLIVPNEAALRSIPPAAVVPIPIVTAKAAGRPESLIEPDKKTWGPRVGLNYRFLRNTVARAGWGMYFTPLQNTGTKLMTGPFRETSDFPDAQPPVGGTPVITLANPYQTTGRGQALLNFFAPETHLKNQRQYNYSLTVEHQLGANAFTIEYVGKKWIGPWAPELNAVPASLTPFSRARLPFPTLGSISGLLNGGHYQYNALRLDASRRFARGLFYSVNYTWAKTIDDVGGLYMEAGSSEDPFNRNRDRSTLWWMPPHRMTVNYIWQVPFGKTGGRLAFSEDKGIGRVLNQIIKGWEIAGTYNFQAAARNDVTGNYLNAAGSNYDAPNTNRFSGRPDCTGQPLSPTAEQKAQGYVFNPNAFSRQVAPGRFGTCGKNLVANPAGSIMMNQATYRNFKVPWLVNRERGANLRIGFHMFNAFNHSNVPGPVLNMNSTMFGKRTSDKSGDVRRIAFQARIDF